MSTRTHNYFVYILTNASRTLYIGVTNNLERRLAEHRDKATPGFTNRYNITQLVYFEQTPDVHAALAREKEIKKWRRSKRVALIESANPEWRDLAQEWAFP